MAISPRFAHRIFLKGVSGTASLALVGLDYMDTIKGGDVLLAWLTFMLAWLTPVFIARTHTDTALLARQGVVVAAALAVRRDRFARDGDVGIPTMRDSLARREPAPDCCFKIMIHYKFGMREFDVASGGKIELPSR